MFPVGSSVVLGDEDVVGRYGIVETRAQMNKANRLRRTSAELVLVLGMDPTFATSSGGAIVETSDGLRVELTAPQRLHEGERRWVYVRRVDVGLRRITLSPEPIPEGWDLPGREAGGALGDLTDLALTSALADLRRSTDEPLEAALAAWADRQTALDGCARDLRCVMMIVSKHPSGAPDWGRVAGLVSATHPFAQALRASAAQLAGGPPSHPTGSYGAACWRLLTADVEGRAVAELDFALNTPELKNDFEVRVALVVALHRAGQRARAFAATRTLATGVWANAARTLTPPIPWPTLRDPLDADLVDELAAAIRRGDADMVERAVRNVRAGRLANETAPLSIWAALAAGRRDEEVASDIDSFLDLLGEDLLDGDAVDPRLLAVASWFALARGRLFEALGLLLRLPDDVPSEFSPWSFWRRWLLGTERVGAPSDDVLASLGWLAALAQKNLVDTDRIEKMWTAWIGRTARWTLVQPSCIAALPRSSRRPS